MACTFKDNVRLGLNVKGKPFEDYVSLGLNVKSKALQRQRKPKLKRKE
jgi:hypothetical protein